MERVGTLRIESNTDKRKSKLLKLLTQSSAGTIAIENFPKRNDFLTKIIIDYYKNIRSLGYYCQIIKEDPKKAILIYWRDLDSNA